MVTVFINNALISCCCQTLGKMRRMLTSLTLNLPSMNNGCRVNIC